MKPEVIFNGVLIASMIVLTVLILIAVVRSILGPRTADRIIAVNMIGTLAITIIAMLAVYLEEDYLADVCLIYAMISFLAVVVLTKITTGAFLERTGMRSGAEAIDVNIREQAVFREEETTGIESEQSCGGSGAGTQIPDGKEAPND